MGRRRLQRLYHNSLLCVSNRRAEQGVWLERAMSLNREIPKTSCSCAVHILDIGKGLWGQPQFGIRKESCNIFVRVATMALLSRLCRFTVHTDDSFACDVW